MTGRSSTVEVVEHEEEDDWFSPPIFEVTVMVAVFVPAEVYDFFDVLELPLALPLHEYVYDPFPPEGLAVHVTSSTPIIAGFGLA